MQFEKILLRNIISSMFVFIFLNSFLLNPVSIFAKTIYMSASGDDSNSGLTQADPILTFNRAKAICQKSSDSSFEILLKGGDTFTQFSPDTISLYSDDISTYAFIWDMNKALTISTYGSTEMAHLYGAGYYLHSGGPERVILIVEPSTKDILIENLFFEMWQNSTIQTHETEDVHIRNIKIDKIGPYYFPEEQTSGVYCDGVLYPKNSTRILIEDVFMSNCHNNPGSLGALHGFYCTRLNHSEIRNCFLTHISGSPFKFRRSRANNVYVHDNECYYTGLSTQITTSEEEQPGFLRYSGDSNSGCPYALVFENNIFHYPYCVMDRENYQTCETIRCSISNTTVCGSGACEDSTKVKWINNDFIYQWEWTENWMDGDPVDPPAAPSNLVATPISEKQVDLTWTDNSDNEEGFIIQRTFGASFIEVGEVDSNVTFFTDDFFLYASTEYTYRVRAFANNLYSEWSDEVITTTPEDDNSPVSGDKSGIPLHFDLKQNYPNPFNASTVITYQLANDCHVQLNIINTNGQVVDVLVDAYQRRGSYAYHWQCPALSSGIYFCQLNAGNYRKISKLVYQN